jgi:hypothetical protein
MKPTPKALTHSLPLVSTSRFAHLCRSRPRGSIRKQAGPTAKQLQRICHDALDFIQVPGFPSAIETRSLPALTRSYPRRLPSMSLGPPLHSPGITHSRRNFVQH